MRIDTTFALNAQPDRAQTQADMQKAAKAFEAIFVRQMIGAMRSASLSEGMLDSSATEQFRDLSDARTAESLSEKGALGIAELLLRQLSPPEPTKGAASAATHPAIGKDSAA